MCALRKLDCLVVETGRRNVSKNREKKQITQQTFWNRGNNNNSYILRVNVLRACNKNILLLRLKYTITLFECSRKYRTGRCNYFFFFFFLIWFMWIFHFLFCFKFCFKFCCSLRRGTAKMNIFKLKLDTSMCAHVRSWMSVQLFYTDFIAQFHKNTFIFYYDSNQPVDTHMHA